LLFFDILVLVLLLPMMIDYFNRCTRARLDIAAQIKIME
jgi:hypothetical protein